MGTAYQAVFNYAFSRGKGGRLVLRIEDTDRARSTEASERSIMSALRWLGIPWDEGPDIGGPHAPYRQSERTAIYREHVERLLSAEHAYRCFCTRERLDRLRAESKGSSTGYDRHCRDIRPREAAERAAAGEQSVVRLKVPTHGDCVMVDLLRGEIRKDWGSIDDQVLLKSDGFPTYHLANVVDDHLMQITHVIRGEEWISSLPKHLTLYRHLGWEPPVFCHLPLLRNPDRSKLSKRKSPTSIEYFRHAGFLPEALRNYLGLMGWAMPDGEEKFTIEEMTERFELTDISLGGPVFDVKKLRWLNGRYIREDYSDERLLQALDAWGLGRDRLSRIVPLAHPRLETLSDWGRLTAAFFTDEIPLEARELAIKKQEPGRVLEILQVGLWMLERLREHREPGIQEVFEKLAAAFDIKLRDLLAPFYVALSGSRAWTPLFASMEVLGPDLVRVRLRRAIDVLGGLSSKKLAELEKRHAALLGESS